jgi:tyrosine-protein kinase Etk/Wzc
MDSTVVATSFDVSCNQCDQVKNVRSAQIDELSEDTLVSAHASTIVQDEGYQVSLLDILIQLAKRKELIAKITLIAAVVGVVLSFVLPVRFTATAKIMPPQQTQSTASMLMSQLAGLSGGSSLAAIATGGLGLKNPNDIYIDLLTSRPVADAIIQKYKLQDIYRESDMTKTREKLSKMTSITSEKSGIISIAVTDRDKVRAAAMANDYVTQLRVLTKSLAVTEASQRRVFYEDQLKQSKDALLTAAVAFEQVQQNKGLVQLDAQARVMIQGLAELRAKVAAKQVQIEAMRSYSTNKNPEVAIAQQELDSLRAEEQRMEQSSRQPGIASLGLRNVPSAGLEYLRAQHELQYQQALYDILMKQYDAARLDESKEAAIIQVVEPAIKPDRKSSPKRLLITALLAMSGFFVGCIAALFLWWKDVLRSDPNTSRQLDELGGAFKLRKVARD